MKYAFNIQDRSDVLRILFFINGKKQQDILRHFKGEKDTGAINRVVRFTSRDPEIRQAISAILHLPEGFWNVEVPISLTASLIVGNPADIE